MVDDIARDRAIYHALKAVDEVAAALQTHLIEEHGADPERAAPQSPSTNSLMLLRQARERLGQGLRAINADSIAESDEVLDATGKFPQPHQSASDISGAFRAARQSGRKQAGRCGLGKIPVQDAQLGGSHVASRRLPRAAVLAVGLLAVVRARRERCRPRASA